MTEHSVATRGEWATDPILDGSVKGWPDLGCRASEVAGLGVRVEDLGTPALTIGEAALSHNIAAMAEWCASRGVALAPHAKTTMVPRLMERQLAAGAWGLTVANARQARVALACGARRVVIANEVTVARDLAWLCAQTAGGEVEIIFCVDSLDGLALAEVARAIASSPHVALRGIEGFEGLTDAPDAFLEDVVAGAQAIATLVEYADPIITAGGSSYFDRVVDLLGPVAAQLGWTLCLRSGCYITHDHGIYAEAADRRAPDAPRFVAAIEVRASVLSRPQPDRLILDCGRRDVSFDAGLPVVLGHDELTVVALNDQHAHVQVDGASDLAIGDVVRLGISHPCTTFDRWHVIAVVDDSGSVLEAVETSF
jgi:D-serine deaminase-like pyridoxal phosphate-dependent protein